MQELLEELSELEDLVDEARHCSVCRFSLPPDSSPLVRVSEGLKILIVMPVPEEQGSLFSAHDRSVLSTWLGISEIQFTTSQALGVLPLGFCFPGSSQGDPPPLCAPLWRPRFRSLLPDLRLTVVLGPDALNFYESSAADEDYVERLQFWVGAESEIFPIPHPREHGEKAYSEIWFKLHLEMLKRKVAGLMT